MNSVEGPEQGPSYFTLIQLYSCFVSKFTAIVDDRYNYSVSGIGGNLFKNYF